MITMICRHKRTPKFNVKSLLERTPHHCCDATLASLSLTVLSAHEDEKK